MAYKKLLKFEKMSWSDTEIIEVVVVTGYFNYINTHSNVFGLGQ